MKKKIISLLMSMLMMAAVFVPVMAEDGGYVGSSTNNGVTTSGTISVGGTTVYLVNGTDAENYKNSPALLVSDAGSVTGDEKVQAVYSNVKNGNDVQYKKLVSGVDSLEALLVIDVSPNEQAKGIVNDNTTVSITISYKGIESNATYYAVHIGEKTQEANKCTNGDGTLTFSMTGFSPVIIYKVVNDSKTTDSSSSSSSVVTCEQANGKGWVWSESKQACVYKVTNTSAK